MRREVAPIVARNKHRREGTSAYGVLNAQPTAAKAGRERLQVRGGRGDWRAAGSCVQGRLGAGSCGEVYEELQVDRGFNQPARQAGSPRNLCRASLNSCTQPALATPLNPPP